MRLPFVYGSPCVVAAHALQPFCPASASFIIRLMLRSNAACSASSCLCPRAASFICASAAFCCPFQVEPQDCSSGTPRGRDHRCVAAPVCHPLILVHAPCATDVRLLEHELSSEGRRLLLAERRSQSDKLIHLQVPPLFHVQKLPDSPHEAEHLGLKVGRVRASRRSPRRPVGGGRRRARLVPARRSLEPHPDPRSIHRTN